MKKMATMLMTGALALSVALMGCGGTKTDTADTTEATDVEQSPEEGAEVLDGGWGVVSEASTQLSEDEQAVFDQALEGMTGVSYTPVRVLATQVVAGTNYAFLCTGETVTAEPQTGWYVVVVYQNLEGASELTSIAEIDVADVKRASESDDADVVGGWAVAEAADVELLPAEAQTAFQIARESYVGVDLHPLATLASQVVAGTNYLILCEGEAVVPDAKPQLYVAEVYADLDGNAELTSVELFDLLAYLEQAK